MKQINLIFALFLLSYCSFAQTKAPAEENDPKAKVILEQLRQKFDSYKSMEVDFTLTIEFPEEDAEVQKGKISQQGDKYKLDLENQTIFSDGKTMWFHLKNRNEVQINTVEENDDTDEILSPRDLLRIFDRDDFLYALVGEETVKGKILQQIEFKPTDRDSEYAKMRLTVDKAASQVVRIKTFAKDGSRFTLQIDELKPNKPFADNFFRFDASQYPGIHVEDLRMD